MSAASTTSEVPSEPLVMAVILRKDLLEMEGWSQGSMIAQGCHAVSKVLIEHQNHEHLKSYLSDMDRMHKVVYEAKNENEMNKIKTSMIESGTRFSEWIEQPENILAAFATCPYPKSYIRSVFKRCKLYK